MSIQKFHDLRVRNLSECCDSFQIQLVTEDFFRRSLREMDNIFETPGSRLKNNIHARAKNVRVGNLVSPGCRFCR